ncbi:MAG: hypothetical protein HWE10_05500 [Gammaproteobacteria bacterium]|nr:hypothetical protein [Gammaproteobacteria bacterium]
MAAKKKSIKNEYAPLFKIIYWSAIGFFFAAVAWMALEGVVTATQGIQKHQRMSQQYQDAIEHNSPQESSSSSEDEEAETDEAPSDNSEEDKPSSTGDEPS